MFIAMNRFKVAPSSTEAFEDVWRNRESHLAQVPGFKSFNLLKGPAAEDHVLYASHAIWESRAAFEAWTKSEAFRAAHKNAGSAPVEYLGPPQLEVFEAVEGISI